MMKETSERRRERRLRYHWPIWFAEDFDEELLQGQMVDICSAGAAFTYYPVQSSLYTGQPITARFSVPCFGIEEGFNMANFTRTGSVCRVDKVNNFLHRIAVHFAEPLPFSPGEQAADEYDTEQKLKAVII